MKHEKGQEYKQTHVSLNDDVMLKKRHNYAETIDHFGKLDWNIFKLPQARTHHLIKRN